MAHRTKKGKFCVAIGVGRYDDYDAYRGIAWIRRVCFRKARQARSYVRAVNHDNPGPDSGGSVARFCKTACPVPKPVKLSPRERRRLDAAQKHARDAIPF